MPGEDWEVEIPKALFASDVILVCLSKNSVNKEGFVQKEITFALDKAMEKPEGTIFIIPVKLEDCEIPRRLTRYQAVDFSRADGRKRLLMGLNKRVTDLGSEVQQITLDDTRKTLVPKSFKPEIKKPKEQEVPVPFSPREKGRDEGKPLEELKQEIPVVRQEEKEPEVKFIQQKPFTKLLDSSSLNPNGTSHSQGIAAEKAASEKVEYEPKQNPERKDEGKPSINNQELPFFSKINHNLSVFIPQVLFSLFMFGLLAWGAYTMFSSKTPKQSDNLPIATATIPSANGTPATQPTETLIPVPTLGIGSTITGEKGETLVYVPAGEFTMGDGASNAPVHTVYLDAFWIDQTEVTNKQYQACVDAGKCEPPSSKNSSTHPSYYENIEFDNYPVLYVNWDKANRYCEVWAGGDLPTEAQWEKAARGTDKRTYPWGEDINCDKANYHSDCIGDTSPVGNYESGKSPYNTYDMAGNVWEWVNDYYQSDYYAALGGSASNPLGPYSGQYRVLRGGSWSHDDDAKRSAFRNWSEPTNTSYYFGFRCARSP